ncbi:uncharacterized protein LOC144919685 [Branchiostoma floridae x Branchiostoma belcheri]
MGDCQYVLAKDCGSGLFTVYTENLPCGLDSAVTCTKTATIVLKSSGKNVMVTFHQGGAVSVANVGVTLPYVQDDIIIHRSSSMFVSLTSSIGLIVEWDGETRMYVTVSPEFKGKTCGLCGNFNGNQMDDFTVKGLPETSVAAFGNSWKANADCLDVPRDQILEACAVNTQRADYADSMCGVINSPIFAACHLVVRPDPYFKECLFDVCECEMGERCLCSAVANYARACAKNYVPVEWRSPELCPVECSGGQEMQQCGSSCTSTCRSLSDPIQGCDDECVEGCNCPQGMYLDEDDNCVLPSECPCYHHGELYRPNEAIHRKGSTCYCQDGVMECYDSSVQPTDDKAVGGLRDREGRFAMCIPPFFFFSCFANPGSKGTECRATCQNMHIIDQCISNQCISGCMCPGGLVQVGYECVLPYECPCYHNGQSYQSGETIQMDCNQCTCRGGDWQCSAQDCTGTCTAYGQAHHITFDGFRYHFYGTCTYEFATDFCGGREGTFRVHIQNELCGLFGATCIKTVTIKLQTVQIIFYKDRPREPEVRPLPGIHDPCLSVTYNFRRVGFFLILTTDHGLTVMWDFGTRVYVMLAPQFRGKVCGLCGNFDGNQANDFTTRALDIAVQPEQFAASWQVNPLCVTTLINEEENATALWLSPCLLNRHRVPWARRQCAIIHAAVFEPCHSTIDPYPWYEACVDDSCACDIGGDCECFCTAVAAYAHACGEAGIPIRWRTPELCPTQCEDYNTEEGDCVWHYHPCGQPCAETCQNEEWHACTLPCLAGCHPTCPNGTLLNEYTRECVEVCPTTLPVIPQACTTTPPVETTTPTSTTPGTTTPGTTTPGTTTPTTPTTTCPPCYDYGNVIPSGESWIRDCDMCTCQCGEVWCEPVCPEPIVPTCAPGDFLDQVVDPDNPSCCMIWICRIADYFSSTPETTTSTIPETTTPTTPGTTTPTTPTTCPPCYDYGNVIPSGESWIRDCKSCACQCGEVWCDPVPCPTVTEPTCPNGSYLVQVEDPYNPCCKIWVCRGTPTPTTPETTTPTTPETTTSTTPETTTPTTPETTTSTTPGTTTPTTTLHPCCAWSEWMNSDNIIDTTDNETYPHLREHYYSFCWDPTEIQCRTVHTNSEGNHLTVAEAGQVGVVCDASVGLLCRGELQLETYIKVCFDYEVRVLCCDLCTTEGTTPTVSTEGTTTTASTTPGTTTPTTPGTTTPGTTTPTTPTTTCPPCYDYGNVIPSGESWIRDCKSCTCQCGEVWCDPVSCPTVPEPTCPDGSDPEQVEDPDNPCCTIWICERTTTPTTETTTPTTPEPTTPTTPETTTSTTPSVPPTTCPPCYVDGNAVWSGESWIRDCKSCTCQCGEVWCDPLPCPTVPPCPNGADPEYVENPDNPCCQIGICEGTTTPTTETTTPTTPEATTSTTTSVPPTTCPPCYVDGNAIWSGESWIRNCRSCTCQCGEVWCDPVTCPPVPVPSCINGQTLVYVEDPDNPCCTIGICEGTTTPTTETTTPTTPETTTSTTTSVPPTTCPPCYVDGNAIWSGESWIRNCRSCTCQCGEVWCDPVTCPPVPVPSCINGQTLVYVEDPDNPCCTIGICEGTTTPTTETTTPTTPETTTSTTTSVPPTTCPPCYVDGNAIWSGESWIRNCRSCTCQCGEVWCDPVTCPPVPVPSCINGQTLVYVEDPDNPCCTIGICEGTTTPTTETTTPTTPETTTSTTTSVPPTTCPPCYVDGNAIWSGESWIRNCRSCTCQCGEVWCDPVTCPPVPVPSCINGQTLVYVEDPDNPCCTIGICEGTTTPTTETTTPTTETTTPTTPETTTSTTTSVPPTTCPPCYVDGNAIWSGESWIRNCRSCTCQCGEVWCDPVPCPPVPVPSCINGQTLVYVEDPDNPCCTIGICEGTTTPTTETTTPTTPETTTSTTTSVPPTTCPPCYVDGNAIWSGESWIRDCKSCTCQCGEVWCDPVSCPTVPEPTCPNGGYLEQVEDPYNPCCKIWVCRGTTTQGTTTPTTPGTTTPTTPGTTTPTTPATTTPTTPGTTTPTTTLHPCCEWSEWMNSDNIIDTTDNETYPHLREHYYSFCWQPTEIQCRTVHMNSEGNHLTVAEAGQVGVVCDASVGLLCRGELQLPTHIKVCFDYEVRVLCCDLCTTTGVPPLETTTPVVGPPETTTPEVGPPETTTPVVGPPETTTPVVRPPETTTPKVGPPETTTPVVGPPDTTTPVVGPPETTTPVVGPPDTTTPGVGPPETTTSVVGPPETTTPVVGPPETTTPVVGPPETTTPGVGPPETTTPGVGPPETTTPVVGPPETTTPGVGPPETTTPGVGPPETTTPVVGPPETTTPVVGPPETTTPGVRPPETTTPGVRPPETTTPVVGPPETTTPGVGPPETTTPGVGPPETTTPVVGPPETTTPGVRPPETTTPGVRPPETTTPVVGPPETTTPGVGPPETTTPGVGPPETTTPGVGPPETTTPVVGPPETTTPVVGPPETTTPGVGPPETGTPGVRPPETTTPGVGPPETTTPVVGPPETTTPVVGPPETTTPGVGPPETTTPVVGPPETTTPGVGPPETTTPVVGPPETTTPGVGPPETTTPGVGPPETTTPRVGPPETTTPGVGPPETTTPGVGPPETTTPGVGPPETTTPVVGPPETTTPGVGPPETTTPGVGPPETTTPGVGPPETTTPVVGPPETSTPVVRPPETTTPGVGPPETSTPVVGPPETTTPVVGPPETTTPGVGPPETTTPVVGPPETTTPGVGPPETTTPGVGPPETTTPGVGPPETTTPGVGPPETTTPVVGPPETTTPGVGPPETTTPVVGPPETTTPVVGPPETTTPVVGPPETTTTEVTTPEVIVTTTPCPPCYVNGNVIQSGESWTSTTTSCTNCTCVCGEIWCEPLQCPAVTVPECVNGADPEYVEDPDNPCCRIWQCPCDCFLYGEPHYSTCDGRRFSHQGNCTYLMAKPIGSDEFEIWAQNFPCTKPYGAIATCTRSVTVHYGGFQVELGRTGWVIVNGQPLRPPVSVGGMTITRHGYHTMRLVIDALGVVVNYIELNYIASIYIPPEFFEDIEGLCGFYDNDQSNDLTLTDGTVTTDTEEFGYDWLVEGELEDCYVNHTDCVLGNITTTACDILLSDVFEPCHDLVDYHQFLEDCEYDVCLETSPCWTITAYAMACLSHGVCIDWRELVPECPSECPPDRIYTPCATECPETCQHQTITCGTGFMEDCACPDGYVLDVTTGDCILTTDCACVDHNNVPHQPGETWYEGPCRVCTCNETLSGDYIEICHDITTCPTSCLPCYTLVNSPGTCCGECVPTSCCEQTSSGVIIEHAVNSTWSPGGDPCEVCECREMPTTGEAFEICSTITCPAPPECPHGDLVEEPTDGCCPTWRCDIPGGVCVRYENQTELTVGGCTSAKPVSISWCEGRCPSGSHYHPETNSFEQYCSCCGPAETETKPVYLSCSDGSVQTHYITNVVSCDCSPDNQRC